MRIGYSRLHRAAAGQAGNVTSRRNFGCVEKAIEWNVARGLFYFRLRSSFLPFEGQIESWSSWRAELASLAQRIRSSNLRISVRSPHKIDGPSEDDARRSCGALVRQSELLDLLGLDCTHKIQIPIGEPGEASLLRFDDRFRLLPDRLQSRLAVENPPGQFGLRSSLNIWSALGVPVVYRARESSIEKLDAAIKRCRRTWSEEDGAPAVDYCAQGPIEHVLKYAPAADYMFECAELPRELNVDPSLLATGS